MKRTAPLHIVVVEAYEGLAETLTADADERAAARGLGLPLAELAEHLQCRFTVLCWDEWIRAEQAGKSFVNWMPFPVTRPANDTSWIHLAAPPSRIPVQWKEIPATDPDHGRSITTELSPLSKGLLAQSDPLFLMSYCLNRTLQSLQRSDRMDAVILPMWGGLGYVAQMARATGIDERIDVPFVMVVTDTSANRLLANQEGAWNRPAVTRRQMEDISLALADGAFVFGTRGLSIARAGRLHDARAPVQIPRRLAQEVLRDIEISMTRHSTKTDGVRFFLDEPQQPSSGIILALDAVTQLQRRGVYLERPLVSAGPTMVFAPMVPRTFETYWSSRGFVRELIQNGQWKWSQKRPEFDGALSVRLYPSLFEHLPEVWSELGKGSLVLLSPAATEGIAVADTIPSECLLDAEPTPDLVAAAIERFLSMSLSQLDELRRTLCRTVVEAQRSPLRKQMIEHLAAELEVLCASPPVPQNLARASVLLLDRCKNLRECEQNFTEKWDITPVNDTSANTLTVVVTCYEMNTMVRDAVRSVWDSDRIPDEVLLVDDGSHGRATLNAIEELQREAETRRLPLRLVRQKNRGLAAARNAGLEVATCDFISFLDGDDIIEPAFYRMALELLGKYPQLGGVAAWSLCLGPGDTIGFWNAPQPELPFLYAENCVFVPCMARTALLRELDGYDTSQRYNYEDWELSCRMLASEWPIIILPAYLQKYFIRHDSLLRTMTPVQNQVMREQFLATHREAVSRFSVELTMLTENRLMQHLHSDAVMKASRRDQEDRRKIWTGKLIRHGKFVARATLRRLRIKS